VNGDGNDMDFVCMAGINEVNTLVSMGFEFGGSMNEEQFQSAMGFVSLKRLDPSRVVVNLIITESREFFDRFVAATVVAKAVNATDRDLRLLIHKAVLYGKI